MNALIRYDAARHALQVAHSVDEAKDIRDQSAALQAYARQRNDVDMERWVAEIKLRACVRIGEISSELEKAPRGGKGGTRKLPNGGKNAILKTAGISTSAAQRYEKLAEDSGRVERYIAEKAARGEPVSLKEALNPRHVEHNSGENEWYTPPDIIERARGAMGAIDCDPASSSFANKNVKANTFYTVKDNGLVRKWHGCIWLNPPYAQPLCSQFCEAVTHKFLDKEIEQACVLVNNATETAWFQGTLRVASAVCFLEGRVKYLDKTGQPANSPLQGQAVLYFGSRVKEFVTRFSNAGIVLAHV